MRDKKKTKSQKTPEQEALEKHVDAMMDPKRPADTAVAEAALSPSEAAPAAQSVPTAPELSPKLRKQIDVADKPAKPLSIDKLDELTKSITEPEPPAESPAEPPAEPEQAEPEEPAPDEDIDTDESADLDDTRTDEAVDDIVAYEGDVMLAVADSTAKERNREALATPAPKKRHIFSTIFWSMVAIVVVLVIALCILLVMGDSLATKLGM